jgi:hypothetical protein
MTLMLTLGFGIPLSPLTMSASWSLASSWDSPGHALFCNVYPTLQVSPTHLNRSRNWGQRTCHLTWQLYPRRLLSLVRYLLQHVDTGRTSDARRGHTDPPQWTGTTGPVACLSGLEEPLQHLPSAPLESYSWTQVVCSHIPTGVLLRCHPVRLLHEAD